MAGSVKCKTPDVHSTLWVATSMPVVVLLLTCHAASEQSRHEQDHENYTHHHVSVSAFEVEPASPHGSDTRSPAASGNTVCPGCASSQDES